jgi:hypothetical protein
MYKNFNNLFIAVTHRIKKNRKAIYLYAATRINKIYFKGLCVIGFNANLAT